jgi:hypothetical protein
MPGRIARVAVFLGSSPGRHPEFAGAARRFGAELARRGIGLVFGGSHVGTMGALADEVLAGGGVVVGVIPLAMVRLGLGHDRVSDLRVVRTMHERKALMYSLADAIAVLPGGVGTLDEFFEVLAWVQLGIHKKPIGILNVLGYYDALLGMLKRAEDEQFLPPQIFQAFEVATEPMSLLDRLELHDFEHPGPDWDWDS